MALSLNEIKIRAQQFVLNWKDKAATAREEADAQTFENEFFAIFGVPRNQQPRRKHRGCCSHKVVAVGFNTLCYDAERRGMLIDIEILFSDRHPCLSENTDVIVQK